MNTIIDFQIRAAGKGDMPAISALMKKSALTFIVPDLTKTAATRLLASLSEESLLSSCADSVQYWVAETDGQLVGAFGTKSVNHVLHCFVDECFQRCGIGDLMWQFVFQAASSEMCDPNFTVNSSLYAVPFYKDLGFVAVSGITEREGVKFVPMRYSTSDLTSQLRSRITPAP